MSRKPIHLEAQGPKGDRQAMWETIRTQHAAGHAISVTSVWAKISPDAPKQRVRDYITGLEAAGYLARSNEPAKIGEQVYYRLARDVGVEAPRVRRDGSEPTSGLGREQLWRTLRILGEFSPTELANAASTPKVQIAENTASEYCLFLHAADYLARTRASIPGVQARYRLIPNRWSGPKAPMIQRAKQLFDPNTGEVVYSRVTSTQGGDE